MSYEHIVKDYEATKKYISQLPVDIHVSYLGSGYWKVVSKKLNISQCTSDVLRERTRQWILKQ